MGTTMSFYYIKNNGMAQEQLKALLAPYSKKQMFSETERNLLISMGMEEQLKQLESMPPPQHTPFLKGSEPEEQHNVLLAYGQDKAWWPLFECRLCDGNLAEKEDVLRLHQQFQTAILAVSLMDSDVATVTACDEQGKVIAWHGKAEDGYLEAYDMEERATDFPAALCQLFPQADAQALKQVWSKKGLVFADERVQGLCQLLGLPLLYDGQTVPTGYVALHGTQQEIV